VLRTRESRLVLGESFLVGMVLIVLQDSPDSLLISA
jgi:hypothetical protein